MKVFCNLSIRLQKKKETPTLTKQEKSSDSLSTENTIAERAKSNRFVFEGALSHLHKPGENPQINDELMKQHLKRTGGKVITRFPPGKQQTLKLRFFILKSNY